MLKSLFPNINWQSIKIIGCDMDGTLYDEFDFIAQAYKPIAQRLAEACDDTMRTIYSWMVQRWLEKGSSYPHIFSEVLQEYEVEEVQREPIIIELLDIFRNSNPQLLLSNRVQVLLDFFKSNFELFLVTDGGITLQSAKFKALGLEKWFIPENVWISGASEPHYQKPSKNIVEKIKILTPGVQPQHVVFFGDREIDRAFALNLNYQFVQTYCLKRAG
jgi:putative hydrolase of the HAD superfamily